MSSEQKSHTVAFGSHLRSMVWFMVIVVAFTGLLFFLYKTKSRLSPAEVEGRIADKWVGYSQSETGSRAYFRLLVETKDGQRLVIEVDQETYERAREGMWIRKAQGKIEMTQFKQSKTQAGSCPIPDETQSSFAAGRALVS